MTDLTEPAGGALAGGYGASASGDTSEDEMLQVVAQSARRTRRPLLLESDSDTDSLPQTSSPDVQLLSNVVAFALPGHAASSPAQPGVSETRTNESKLKQLSTAAVVVISDSSDDAAPAPVRDVFELSPSSRLVNLLVWHTTMQTKPFPNAELGLLKHRAVSSRHSHWCLICPWVL